MKKVYSHFNKGSLLVEIILATALFSLFITAFMGVYLYGNEATMLSGNRARAVMLAEEGAEAVRNIRDSAFTNLSDGTWGLNIVANQYSLLNNSDTDGFFTRAIDIVSVGPKRKDVTTTVSWQQNEQRPGSVSIVTRLTNWIASGIPKRHLLIYGDSTTIPKFREYDDSSDSFGPENSTINISSGNTFILRTSPKENEAIAGFVDSYGILDIICYDGTSWNYQWSAFTGGVGNDSSYDIAYETNSGDVMVLYGNDVPFNNEMSYRTKSGTSPCGTANWSNTSNLDPIRTNGGVWYLKMAWDRRSSSDLIAAIWADGNSDLSAMIWDGNNWGNEPNTLSENSLDSIYGSPDVESFDLEYESLSGDLMVIWGNSSGSNGVNGVRYRTCEGGVSNCSWSNVLTPPTFRDDATNLDISAHPDTDEMVFASIGNVGNDLQIGYWSGSSWTNKRNADTRTATPRAGTHLVSTGWLVSGGVSRSIIVYADSWTRRIDWFTGDLGVFTKQSDVNVSPAFSRDQGTLDLAMNPLSKNMLMYTFSDRNNYLFAKRLVMDSSGVFTWTNSDTVALTTTLPHKINYPFSFAFLRN